MSFTLFDRFTDDSFKLSISTNVSFSAHSGNLIDLKS